MTGPPSIDGMLAVAERQRQEGLHPGAQLYVSLEGKVVCDTAVGEAAPGRPLRPDHVMLLYSAGKPFTTVAVLQLVEQGRLGLDDLVGRFIPGWGAGKEACTVRHVLTHMGGFSCVHPDEDLFDQDLTYAEEIAWLAAHPAEHEPGTAAAYHPFSGWKVLGEVVRVVDGRPIDVYLREMVFGPLGLDSTYLGVPAEEQARLGERLCPVHWTGHTVPVLTEGGLGMVEYHIEDYHNEPWFMAKVEPGGGARGPARELGRFYEALGRGGEGLFQRAATVDLMAAVHRSGVPDRTFLGMRLPWGLGVQVARGISGTVGYRTFGHGGMASSRAFCDPVEGLVMVYVANGLCNPIDNERRQMEITEAVYGAVAPVPRGPRVTAG